MASPLSLEVEPSQAAAGLVDRLCRKLLSDHLHGLRGGCIELNDGDSRLLGDEAARPRVELRVLHPRFYRRVVFGGAMGFAESLMDGDCACDDLVSLVQIFIRNLPAAERLERGWGWLRNGAARIQHAVRRNSVSGSRKNIHEHYDLGNRFFSLFLDPTMSYSCGVFEEPSSTLLDASNAKMERVCRKLDLQPGDHLLEIGSGWGGLAAYAAKNFGCRVTTTTISQEQHRWVQETIHREGLEDRVTPLLQDYRELRGQYNKLVSIEMIEAVGHQYYGAFFRRCGELLSDDGQMLIQGIVIGDHRFQRYTRTVNFVRRYVFPGGCLPSISELTRHASAEGRMRLVHLEDFAPHYARTLRCWREQFLSRLDEVRELGFDDWFIRMWEYYLCYCEAGFHERHVNLVQMTWSRPGCRRDPQAGEDWFTRPAASEPSRLADHDTDVPAERNRRRQESCA